MGATQCECSCDKGHGQPFPEPNTHREREVTSETTSAVESVRKDSGKQQLDEIREAKADIKILLKLDSGTADVGADDYPKEADISAVSPPSESSSPVPDSMLVSLPPTMQPIADESYFEIEIDEIESEDDSGAEMMFQQFGHLLHRHTSEHKQTVEELDFVPSASMPIRGLYPPLSDATFECEVKVLTMNAEVTEGIKMMNPTGGGTPTLARRRHSTAKKLIKSFSFSAGQSFPELLRRRGVSVSSVYSHKGVDNMYTTDKCDSREFDANIVDIRESFAFALHTDAGEHVVGSISFEAKEGHGTFSKTKTLGFGGIVFKEAIGGGMISRRGDWTEINLALFEMHKSKFKALKKKLRKRGKEPSKRPLEVGSLQLRCRLHWTEEVVAAFQRQVSERRVTKSKTLRRKEVFAEMDLFYLLTHRSTTLRLTVLAVLFDVSALGEWDTDDTVRLIRELRETGTHSTVFADAIEDTLVSGTYQCRDRLRTKRTPAHSSKNADVLFIGETLAFKLKPFAPELADAREADAGGDWHPQVRFQRDEATKQPPGSVQLAVDRKSQRIGAALFLLRDMLPHAAVADSLASNKHLFVLPVFQWLPAAQCLADAVQTKVALMFCIAQFLWDEE